MSGLEAIPGVPPDGGDSQQDDSGVPVPPAAPPGVEDLAAQLVEARDVQRTILEETLQSARKGQVRESGRTACGSPEDLRGPAERYPRAVNLKSCPRGLVGIWHTHVTRQDLASPEHSIPDWSLVAFGAVDASVVVGYDTSELLVVGEERQVMKDEFLDVLGIDARGPEGVVAALSDGRIGNPRQARSRLREHLQDHVTRVPTRHEEIARQADRQRDTLPAFAPRHRLDHTPVTGTDVCDLRSTSRRANATLRQTASRLNIKEEAISTGVGVIVGGVVNRLIFGTV